MNKIKIYDLQVDGYTATGKMDKGNITLDVDVDFTVENASEDLYIDIISIDAWASSTETMAVDDEVDLDDLAEQIVSKGDSASWEEDEAGTRIDRAMDLLDTER